MVASVESRIFYLASLVLGDLVLGMLAAVLALAVGLTGLGNVDLDENLLLAFRAPYRNAEYNYSRFEV